RRTAGSAPRSLLVSGRTQRAKGGTMLFKKQRKARRTKTLGVVGVFLVLGMLAAAPSAGAATPAADCQPFTEPCLLPFPNDLFTKSDSTSATGLRVDLPQAAMPTNKNGVQIGVGPYNRSDGFSPGASIIARVPGLDNQAAFNNTDP